MVFLRLLLGLAVGLATGWAAGRLYAPKAGAETRQCLRARYEEIAAEARKAAEAKQAEMQSRYEAAKRAGTAATSRPGPRSRR